METGMLRRQAWFILLVIILVPVLAACRPASASETVITVQVQVTATQSQALQPSPAPATPQPPSSTEAVISPEPGQAANPISATLEAMKSAARENPLGGTPAPAQTRVASSDYVGIFELAWQTIADNYVRDDFNGVDWQAVHDEYLPRVQEVRSQNAFWDLMEQFVDELKDDHSRFVRPDRFAAEFDLPQPAASGQPWPGFIVWPAREDEYLFLWDVCESGPAASAGLKRGDIILEINGKPVERGENGFDTGEINQALYAKEDEVLLSVQQGPNAGPRQVRIRFGGASGCDGWSYGVLSDEPYIGYIRVPDFGGNSSTNIEAMIEMLEEERPLEGLVVDVRHNPGGNADRSVSIFAEGTFGKVGPLREGATQTIFRIRGPVRWSDSVPMAVLTDGSSHSAAEYFATALQQAGRATLVGMPTAGNTEGITGFSLPDGSLIRLAVMTLVLPDGSTLEETGVQPDLRVPLGQWGLREQPDVQLMAAYEAVVGKINP